MNQEERTIKEQFRQLKLEDERHAPPFAHTWANALARGNQRAYSWRPRWIAVAALALLVCGAALWRLRESVTPPLPLEVALPGPTLSLPRVSAPPSSLAATVSPRRTVHRQRTRPRPQPALSFLSQWRSPTEYLLRLPGDPLLKTVPRFGESWFEIKKLASEQKNEWEEL